MVATAAPTLRFNRLEVSNFLRVEALTVDADGNHVVMAAVADTEQLMVEIIDKEAV